MDVYLQKIIDKEIPIHEAISGIALFFYTEDPTPAQMAARWGVPVTDIHEIYYKLSRSDNKEQAITLFKAIMYLVEAGIYTNLSHVKTKLNQL